MTRLCLLLAALPLAAQPLAVVNSADYTARLAPGALITIFGANLPSTSVTVNGRSATIFHAGASQINAQLPFEIAPGAATLQLGTTTVPLQIDAAAPAVFDTAPPPTLPGGLVTIYLTGQGEVSPDSTPKLSVSATLGGVAAAVETASLAFGLTGVTRADLRVPALPPGRHAVVVTIGGASSNRIFVEIHAPPETWPAALHASKTGAHTHAGRTYASSSALRLEWQPPSYPVHHYEIAAAERRSTVRLSTPADARDAVVRDLKSGTEYTITLAACLDPECAIATRAAESATAVTEDEYWAIQGAGNSYATAARLVPDGNVGSYAFRYGPWAGPALDGKVQLYYNPLGGDEKGAKIGEQAAPDALSFRGISGFGLLRACQPAPGSPANTLSPDCVNSRSLAAGVALYQAVPLAGPAGGKVRLYFEAQGFDGRTRILYLDSHDGYIGRDFHSGPPTRCSTLADYSAGGGCEPTLALGVDVDGDAGNPVIRNARQFKIAYAMRDSSAWDLKPGTSMWFTTEWPDGRCSAYGYNTAFAVWNGSRWSVAYRPDGCPKMLPGAQAPAIAHLGGARYKLYFNLHPATGGPSDPRVGIKPMRLLYADPNATGDPAIADFEDWEPLAAARQLHYLWPDGSLLTPDEESRLDDYVVLAPSADPERLVMYSNMSATGTTALPFIGSAVLINP
jgi:uncharacterized protein (TIGR03437 family)